MQPSQPWRNLSLTVSCAFSQGHHTTRNIVQWEKSWINLGEISKRKKRVNSDLQMYDKDVNNVIKEFARIQRDSKYYFSQIKMINK